MVADLGKESEWNEASFKSKRLHEIQEAINLYKSDPLGFTDGKFNYFHWSKWIEALYGEGRSKYKKSEKEELDKLKKDVDKTLRLMPPHIKSKKHGLTNKKSSYLFNEKNYDMLMNLLYEFEMKVRDYNDEHGLTTKNKSDVPDLF